MSNIKSAILICSVGLLATGVWFFFSNQTSGTNPTENGTVLTSKKTASGKATKTPERRIVRKRIAGKAAVPRPERKQPTFDIGADEESKLTEAQKQLLLEIRAALKVDDWRKLVKLVQNLQALDEWPDGVPVAIRRASIDALSFYGSKCLPEVVGFMGDADAEVVDAATESFWDSVTDPDLSDLEIETNLLAAMKVIKDEDSIRSMLSEVITTSMRNSRAVDTIKQLMTMENAAIKAELPSVIEELTDDPNITTAEQLDEWLTKNPDDSDAEEMYGGVKETDTDVE